MSARIVQLHRPKTFTQAEHVIETLRIKILEDGRPYRIIAGLANVSTSTINSLTSGKTRWPRHTTLFPLLAALNLVMEIHPKKK